MIGFWLLVATLVAFTANVSLYVVDPNPWSLFAAAFCGVSALLQAVWMRS